MEFFEMLQHNAIEKHITILNLLKDFFNHVKQYSSSNVRISNNFDMDSFLEISWNLKKETLKLYNKIIERYPEEKVYI